MQKLPKLIDSANEHGYSIRQHESGVYQVHHGRVGLMSVPAYTSHSLDRCRAWASKLSTSSGDTISSFKRAERGQVQLGLRLSVEARNRLVTALDKLRQPGETNADVILRVISQIYNGSRK